MTEQQQLAAVQQDGLAIRHLKAPSEAVQLAAVQQDGHVICYLKAPSKAVQLAAVQQNSHPVHRSAQRGRAAGGRTAER